jgi:hypothetical protein
VVQVCPSTLHGWLRPGPTERSAAQHVPVRATSRASRLPCSVSSQRVIGEAPWRLTMPISPSKRGQERLQPLSNEPEGIRGCHAYGPQLDLRIIEYTLDHVRCRCRRMPPILIGKRLGRPASQRGGPAQGCRDCVATRRVGRRRTCDATEGLTLIHAGVRGNIHMTESEAETFT